MYGTIQFGRMDRPGNTIAVMHLKSVQWSRGLVDPDVDEL